MKARLVRFSTWIGVAFWILLGSLRLREAWQEAHLIPALLAAQAGLIVWLLATRRQPISEANWPQKIVSWVSALLPLAFRIHHETQPGKFISICGLLLVLWALGTLGRAFGIAPAYRGIVRSGPYAFIRHPMYLGELISLSGTLMGDPSIWNISLISLLLLTLLLRIHWEEQALDNYGNYRGHVRWRMIPGVW
jgi:protein-S-isoprenylcysteine O-methyltransferase Ste14